MGGDDYGSASDTDARVAPAPRTSLEEQRLDEAEALLMVTFLNMTLGPYSTSAQRGLEHYLYRWVREYGREEEE